MEHKTSCIFKISGKSQKKTIFGFYIISGWVLHRLLPLMKNTKKKWQNLKNNLKKKWWYFLIFFYMSLICVWRILYSILKCKNFFLPRKKFKKKSSTGRRNFFFSHFGWIPSAKNSKKKTLFSFNHRIINRGYFLS